MVSNSIPFPWVVRLTRSELTEHRISQDMEDSPHVYNQRRDIWDAGVLMIQMLMGLDAISRYSSVWSALEALKDREYFSSSSCPLRCPSSNLCFLSLFPLVQLSNSLQAVISSMFDQSKKTTITCSQVILKLKGIALETLPSLEKIMLPGKSSHTEGLSIDPRS